MESARIAFPQAGTIRVLDARLLPFMKRGFRLLLKVNGDVYEARVDSKGVEVKKKEPSLAEGRFFGLSYRGILYGALLAAMGLLAEWALLGTFLYLPSSFVLRHGIFFPLIYAVALWSMDEFIGRSSERTLLNKIKWVLEGDPPRDPEGLREALRRASPYDPHFGVVRGFAFVLLLALLAPYFPISLAAFLAWILAAVVREVYPRAGSWFNGSGDEPNPFPHLAAVLETFYLGQLWGAKVEPTAQRLAELLSALDRAKGGIPGGK